MADKFGGQKDGRQSTGATFYDVPAVPVNANALYFPNFPTSPFFGVAEYPVAAGDLGAFSTSGVFVFDKPVGWIDNPGRKVFYRPKTAATGEIVAQEIKGDVFIGYQILDNINPQKLGVLLASPEFCMTVLMITSTADSGAGSLRQAIANAHDGDVILFDSDVFPAGQTTSILLSSYLTVNKSISIYGGFSDGAGGYTSGASKRYYVYRDVEGVKTKVYVDDETPAQEGEIVLFENVCRVALDGQGAARCLTSTSQSGAEFNVCGLGMTNGMATSGGGFYASNTAKGNFYNCSFDGCAATNGNGGGVCSINTSQIILTGCSITGCVSNYYGGGVYFSSSRQSTLNDCVFDGCTATIGGGVYSSGSSQNTLNDCNISGCSATNGGGVYSASTSQNTLNACTFDSCVATTSGGGVDFAGTGQNTLNDCTFNSCVATNGSGGALFIPGGGSVTVSRCKYITNSDTVAVASTSILTSSDSEFNSATFGNNAQLVISDGITTAQFINTGTATITINDGAALTLTGTATIGAATISSAGRGYLATAAGIDISAATLTNVVACSYGAGLESFEISADGATWTADDLTTPILIETRDAGGDWQTLTDSATGGEYATTFALESTARAFDGVAFFVATLPGYWQADAGAVDSNDWSVKGFAANSNGGGDAQGDAAQGWTVTPSTVTPNADGV